jgi:hypothetical protein
LCLCGKINQVGSSQSAVSSQQSAAWLVVK